MKKIYCLLFAALISGTTAEAQKKVKIKTKSESNAPAKEQPVPLVKQPLPVTAETFAQSIKAEDLSRYLHVLASDAYEGRETGKKGQKMAAEYISGFFRENGIPSPEKLPTPYYQTFQLEQSSWKSASLRVNNKEFTFQNDFNLNGDIASEQTKINAVFAGYGIDEKEWPDYKNLNVKGKTVIVLSGEPMLPNGKYRLTNSTQKSAWGTDSRRKLRIAASKGAKGIIYIYTGSDTEFAKQMEPLRHRLESPVISFPNIESKAVAMYVSQSVGAAMLGTKPQKIESYIKIVTKAGIPIVSPFKIIPDITLIAAKNRTTINTENVLGFIEGTDKKDEILVITAHYDHIGKDTTNTGDQIYNGADDDGSGTSAVLELAQAFNEAKKAGAGPRRSILFMTVTGEEKGLLGSEYYSNNPVFPLAQTIADLNIDMIGRLDKDQNNPNYVYVIGSDKLSSELHSINETANKEHTQLKLDYTFNDENDPNRFYYRSDHYNFAKNGIPVAFYFNGVHDDYHQPGDEVAKILFDKMEKITRLVFYTAWELANREERIKVDSNKK